MKRHLLSALSALILCAFTSHAGAQGITRVCQQAVGANGSNNCVDVSPLNPLSVTGGTTGFAPYAYTPLTGAQYNQSATTATALTIPAGANYARICAVGGAFNFVDTAGSASPTTGAAPNVGTPLASGSCIIEQGAAQMAAFSLINQVNATGAWVASYFK